MRYILHVKNTPNNYRYNISDYKGNTLICRTAKQLRYKSKQVRSTIVIQNIWHKIINDLRKKKIKQLSLHFQGSTYFKKKFIKTLTKQNFLINGIELHIPFPFNGCKTKHLRRV
jgi:small subunit ribosomal protein S11